PDAREVGDHEERLAVERAEPIAAGDLLLDDRAGERGAELEARSELRGVATQDAHPLHRHAVRDLVLLPLLLRLLELLLCDCAAGEEELRTRERFAGQLRLRRRPVR